MPNYRLSLALVSVAALTVTAPALARPGGWGSSGWEPMGRSGWQGGAASDRANERGHDSREGKVEVSRFLAQDQDVSGLGKGRISVAALPGTTADARESATFEAAVIDQLAKSGYDTIATAPSGQVVELKIVHDLVRPEEAPHRPVSGEMSVGVGTRGSTMGMAINVDMTKPLKALVSTRLEARIRDRASGALLWEGRADVITREGDSHWTSQTIASRLAGALFDGFPARS